MKILSIDSSNSMEITVTLKISDQQYCLKRKTDSRKAQVILALIKQVLHKNKLVITDIQKIEINTGPGSFTGLRVGVSIANALSFLLKIPVNNNPTGKLVEPVYK